MSKKIKTTIAIVATFALVAVFSACGVEASRVDSLESGLATVQQDVAGVASGVGTVSDAATSRHFYVTLVEWKGTTSTNDLDAPTTDPAGLSDGYGFKGPGVLDADAPDKWQVATYVFTPASMVAFQGDTIDLTAFVVNGNNHEVWVESPTGAEAAGVVEMHRGREYNISFTASEAGTYILHCDDHDPTMTGYIQVLPR